MDDELIHNSKILVIDDEPMLSVMLIAVLQSKGYKNVRSITDPREALRTYHAFRPDLILLDLKMEPISGVEVLRQLRAVHSAEDYLPIVVLTAADDTGAKLETLELGATEFLLKPYEPSEIVLRVRNLLQTRLLHRQLQDRHDELEVRVAQRTAELSLANASLSKEQEFLAVLLENVHEGIVACDAKGVLTYFNRVVRDMHNLPPAAIPPEQWAKHYSLFLADGKTPMRTEDVPLFRALRGEIVRDAEVVVAPPGAAPHIVLASGKALTAANGEKLGAVVVMHDITDRKRADEALKNLFGELGARVADRTAEVAQRNEELRATMRENIRLVTAIKHSTTAVVVSDPSLPDNPLIFVNPAFTEITGYLPEESLGRNCRFLQGEETDEATIQKMRGAIVAGRPFHGTLLNYRKDRTPFWNEISINPVFDEDGGLINFIGLQKDVTGEIRAREALLASDARYHRIAANVPGMVYQFRRRADGSILFPYVSEGSCDLFGIEPAEIEADANVLISRIDPADIEQFTESLRRSGATLRDWNWEGRITRRPGDIIWVQGASRPERQANGDILWEGLLMDITVRKRTEELALRAREEAEQANRAKGEFLSRMSHELRTPLNAILGFGQLLEVDAKTPDDVESIQQILKAGRYLLGMINEVLNSAQIDTERTTTTLEEVNVTELLRETVESVRPLAFARDVHLKHVDSISEPHARADRHRLKEVVIELLSNAVKGSRAGGSVTVACDRRGTRTDATTRITISDCVQGFSSGKVVNLFAASESRDAARSLIQETELGLSLSKRTIELMGGRVIAEMEPEKGGTISIELLGAEFP